MRQLIAGLVLSLILSLILASAAAAHALLDRAEPKVGSRLAAPTAVRLWFSEVLEPSLCTVAVDGPPGFGGAGPTRTGAGLNALAVTLRRPIPAGRYVVRWRVVSVDSHMTQGDFSFEVAP